MSAMGPVEIALRSSITSREESLVEMHREVGKAEYELEKAQRHLAFVKGSIAEDESAVEVLEDALRKHLA